jgi:hypothetical protein
MFPPRLRRYLVVSLLAFVTGWCGNRTYGQTLREVIDQVEDHYSAHRLRKAYDGSPYDSDSVLVTEADTATAYEYLRVRAIVRQEMSDDAKKDIRRSQQFAKEAFDCWEDLFDWLVLRPDTDRQALLVRKRKEKNGEETYLENLKLAAKYIGDTMWSAICVPNDRQSCPEDATTEGTAACHVYQSMDNLWLSPASMQQYLRLFDYPNDASVVLEMRGDGLKKAVSKSTIVQRTWGELAWRLRELAKVAEFERYKIKYNTFAAAIWPLIPESVRKEIDHAHAQSPNQASSNR